MKILRLSFPLCCQMKRESDTVHQAPRMQNDEVNNAEFAEIHDNTLVTVSPLLVGNNDASFSATSFVTGEKKISSDADKHQINIPLEITANVKMLRKNVKMLWDGELAISLASLLVNYWAVIL